MAGHPTPRHSHAAANGAPTLTPLGHYAGRPAIPISRTVTLVGSRHDARLHLHSSTVSKSHCLIVNSATGAYVRDLASRTKVFVNGKPHRETELHDGDKLQIGKFEFQFNAGVNVRPGKPQNFDPAPPAVLHVEGAEMPLAMEDRVMLIGRRATCDVPLTEESVSTTHAVILEMNGKRYIRDLGSRTGTFVNGKRIEQQDELNLGDEIRIGETQMTYGPAVTDEAAADLDELIAPPPAADALDDLAAAVGTTGTASEPLDEIAAEAESEAAEVDLQEPERAEAAGDAGMAAIEQELGLSPALGARSGWRSRIQEEAETEQQAEAPEPQPAEAVEPEPAAEAPQEENVDALAPLEMEAEAEAPQEPAIEAVSPRDVEADVAPDAEAPVADELAPEIEVDAAGIAPAEAPAEEIDVRAEEEVRPEPVVADTADVNVIDEEENIHDEVAPAPVALDEPLEEAEPEIEIGEVPSLELAETPQESEEDAAALAEAPAETLELAEPPADTLDLEPLTLETPAEEPQPVAEAPDELELKLPEDEAPGEATEAVADAQRAAQRGRSRRKKGEPIEIELPESVTSEAPEPTDEPAPALADAGDVEVLDHTQPTPESAQSLEDAVADLLAESPAQEPVTSPELSDTAFGRNVEAFAGESTGPLVEAREGETTAQPSETEAVTEPPTLEEMQAAAAPDAGDELSLYDTPFAADEPAAAGIETDTAGQATDAAAVEAAAADALVEDALAKLDADTVDETPEEAAAVAPPPLHQQTAEPVAEARPEPAPPAPPEPAPPVAPQAKPEPVAEKPRRPVDLTGWGPNQEHFLGGMPLQLDQPAPQAPRAPQQPPRGQPMRPAAEGSRPVPPRPAGKGAPRQRSPFDLTPGDVPTEDVGGAIPPYSGTNAKKGRVTTGFDGLAMPPVRQADVFSQMATPAAFVNGILGSGGDVFGGKQGSVPSEKAAAPRRGGATPPAQRGDGDAQRPGDAAPAEKHPEEQWPQADVEAPVPAVAAEDPARRGRQSGRGQLPPAIPPNAAEAYPAPPRKRRWFGLRGLLLLMMVCMIAAVAGIYALVPPRAIVQGTLAFRNFTALNEKEQRTLKSRQQQLLAGPALRETARTILRTNEPDATPGFLNDPVAFSRSVAEVKWNGGTMVFRRDGTSPRHDPARVHAVLAALYQANGDIVEEARKLRTRVEALTEAHARAQQRVADLKASMDRTRAAAEERPDPSEIAALEEESARLETAWSDAVANVKNLEVDLKRMRDGLSATPQPAGTAAVPVVDPQLAGLEKGLNDLNNQIAQLQKARSTSTADARKQLDAALAAFEKDVADASATTQAAPAGPELSAYLTAAQNLQRTTRELTDQLIGRQQQQQERLTEIKASLDEKRNARRNEQIQKDPQLKEWNDELAIAQRQHSAALSAGLKNDAEEYRTHVDTLQKMIASRQALTGDDALVADAIAQLETMIADTTKSLEADRQSTEAALERMQQTFAQSQPAVEKLPAEQQALAATLSKRLAAVTEARRAYTQAAGSTANDEQLQKLREEAATLASTVADRKKQLAADSEKTQLAAQEQGRIEEVKKRETELAAARDAEAKAQAAWEASVKKLRGAQARVIEARDAGEKNDRLAKERDDAQSELELQLRTLEAVRAQLAKKVDPVPPEEKDIRIEPGGKMWQTYSLFAVVGIAAVFTVLILFSVKSDRSAAVATRPVGDDNGGSPDAPLLSARLEAVTGGNGRPAESHEKPGRHEDEAPVSV